MNELMGLVLGAYHAKAEGFVPGGASLHNCMAGHGPDAETFERASSADLKPQYPANRPAFMFETQLVVRLTEFAMSTRILQHESFECRQGLKKRFRGAGPVRLPTGEVRTFLEDGDQVTFRASAEKEGLPRLGFGECEGIAIPAKT